jgi:aminoglycoside 6'-N-acetyltransferase I
LPPELKLGTITVGRNRIGERMQVTIGIGTRADVEDWAHMRQMLWPEISIAEHRSEILGDVGSNDSVVFLARDDGAVIGFAEATLRTDYVNGSSSSPVGFLEGLYVAPAVRRRGIARGLIAAVEAWAASAGCSEIASDALIGNLDAHSLHEAIGFEETERVVFFVKKIAAASNH